MTKRDTKAPITAGKAIDSIRRMRDTRSERLAKAEERQQAKHEAIMSEMPARIEEEDEAKEAAILERVPEADRDMVRNALGIDDVAAETVEPENPLRKVTDEWQAKNGGKK